MQQISQNDSVIFEIETKLAVDDDAVGHRATSKIVPQPRLSSTAQFKLLQTEQTSKVVDVQNESINQSVS